jgi:hypothetical protein
MEQITLQGAQPRIKVGSQGEPVELENKTIYILLKCT